MAILLLQFLFVWFIPHSQIPSHRRQFPRKEANRFVVLVLLVLLLVLLVLVCLLLVVLAALAVLLLIFAVLYILPHLRV